MVHTPGQHVRPVLVIHGGAGTIARGSMSREQEEAYHAALTATLVAGQTALLGGTSSVDAVVVAVQMLEDSPLFNAGRGAVFTSDGRNELDASIMDGRTRAAGAVAGATSIKNPITAARAVMLHSNHVMLSGSGADTFAREQGLEMAEPGYFFTQERWEQLQRARAREGSGKLSVEPDALDAPTKFGTVGAVAVDLDGNVAAGTSTGGLTNKRFGRIGDSPIIGAGTYADNGTAAVSATGVGEAFMRAVASYEVAALMKYRGLSLAAAIDEVATKTVPACGGSGGLIGVDAHGNAAMSFSTERMYRGVVRGDGLPDVAIY